VGPYKINKIILPNAVELELPSTIKIHPVVNVSRICRYVGQVEGQRKEQLALVIIKGECKGTPLFLPLNCTATLWSSLSLFKYY